MINQDQLLVGSAYSPSSSSPPHPPPSPPTFLFIASTTGDGAAPPSFAPFWAALLTAGLPADLLAHLRVGVFALGDSSYGRYNWVGKKLWRRLAGLGARPVEPGPGAGVAGGGGEGLEQFTGFGMGDDQEEFG